MIDEVVIPLAGMAIPIVIVPTILGFKMAQKKRDYEHLERMRALETGQALPSRTAWPAAVTLTSIGAGVPIASFFFTFLASVNGAGPGEIWIAPVVATLLSSLVTGNLAPKLLSPPRSAPFDPLANGKPVHDPDAFDVVGRRG